MEKELIPYKQALELKELGFDISCYERYYNGELQVDYGQWNGHSIEHIVSAPLYQQAFRWFRENYNLYNQIHKGYGWEGIIRDSNNGDILWNDGTYNSPEETELECLKKLIEIAKDKQNAGTI